MVKKLFIFPVIFLSTFVLGFTALCAESGNEYYEEYDNYEEFESQYINGYEEDTPLRSHPLLSKISAPALLIGAVTGACTALMLLKKYFLPPQAQPYFRKAEQKSETVYENDSLTD